MYSFHLIFTFYLNIAANGTTFIVWDKTATDTVNKAIGHNRAQVLQDKLREVMFGSVVTPKLQVGAESTATIDMPIDEISSRIALGYKHVSIKNQTDATAALGEIKTGIQRLTEVMSKVGAVQAQLKRSADAADVSILQQNNALISLTAADLAQSALGFVNEQTKMQTAINAMQTSMQSFKLLASITQNL